MTLFTAGERHFATFIEQKNPLYPTLNANSSKFSISLVIKININYVRRNKNKYAQRPWIKGIITLNVCAKL